MSIMLLIGNIMDIIRKKKRMMVIDKMFDVLCKKGCVVRCESFVIQKWFKQKIEGSNDFVALWGELGFDVVLGSEIRKLAKYSRISREKAIETFFNELKVSCFERYDGYIG